MRVLALVLVTLLAAGCTSLGQGGGDLAVLQDLAPFEARVRLENPTDGAVVVTPQAFRLVGADGHVFPGVPSGREEALGTTTLGAGRVVEGWVAFDVQGRAVRPLTLVFEAEGLRLETELPAVG